MKLRSFIFNAATAYLLFMGGGVLVQAVGYKMLGRALMVGFNAAVWLRLVVLVVHVYRLGKKLRNGGEDDSTLDEWWKASLGYRTFEPGYEELRSDLLVTLANYQDRPRKTYARVGFAVGVLRLGFAAFLAEVFESAKRAIRLRF